MPQPPVLGGAPLLRAPHSNLGIARSSNRINAPSNTPTPTPGNPVVIPAGTGTPASTDTQELTVIVPAVNANGSPGTYQVHVPGISFYFPTISTTAGINARAMNPGQAKSLNNYPQGTGLRFGTQGFAFVELQNPTAAAVTVTIVIGGGIPNQGYDEFIDKRVIIINNPASNVFTQNGVTFSVGLKTRVPAWADSIGGGATQTVADGYLGRSRKTIYVTNNDATTNVLTIQDSAGNNIGNVNPGTAWVMDTGGTIKITNPNGGAVSCNIGETYYS